MTMDYYKILEVDSQASPEVIQKAYRALSLRFHPDQQAQAASGNKDGHMRQLNEAYHVLSDPERRRKYDASRLTWDVWLEHGLFGLLRNFISRSTR